MKKIISLSLIAVFMLTALVSCTYSDDPFREGYGVQNNTAATTATETEYCGGCHTYVSAIPKGLDFEGIKLNVLVRDGEKYTREWSKQEASNNEIDIMVQNRNQQLKEELNLELEVSTLPYDGDWENFNNVVLTDPHYDMYAHGATQAANLQIRGYQANMLDKELFPYFDFSMPCWNESLVKKAVNNKLYYVAGELNLSMLDNTVVMWHNQSLYNEYKTDADPKNLQDTALDGGFTYDMLYRWSELCVDMKSGDPRDNIYFMSDLNYAFYEAVPYAWKLDLINTNADGTHSLNIYNNKRAENVISALRNLTARKGVGNCFDPTDTQYEAEIINHFLCGKALFMPNTLNLGDNNSAVRSMADDYAILPIPKYFEQKNYGTTSIGDFNLVSVAADKGDIAWGGAVSALFQRLTELSYIDIKGYYVESLIKPLYFDEDDFERISKSIEIAYDLIDTTWFDISSIYGVGMEDLGWHMYARVEQSDGTLYDQFTKTPDFFSSIWTPEQRLEWWEGQLSSFDAYMFAKE